MSSLEYGGAPMNATIRVFRLLAPGYRDTAAAEPLSRHSHRSCGGLEVAIRHHLAVCSMFALFACAYFSLDRLPGSAVSTLRGGTEFLTRCEISPMADGVS